MNEILFTLLSAWLLVRYSVVKLIKVVGVLATKLFSIVHLWVVEASLFCNVIDFKFIIISF